MTATSVMRREIEEQPAALAATYEALREPAAQVAALLQSKRSVMFLARGTSDNAATYGRYLTELVCGRLTASGSPSIATLYDAPMDLRDTLVVVLSQSGSTAELVEAAAWAKRRGAATVALTNTPHSALVQACDLALVTAAGAELAVPATKSFTAQLLALAMMTGAPWVPELATVGGRIGALLDQLQRSDAVPRVVAQLAAAKSVVCTGRAFTLAVAQEAALKLKETTGLPCTGLSLADLQHGPLAMLGPQVPLVVFSPPTGPCLSGLAEIARLGAARGAPVITVGGPGTPTLPAADLNEALSPLGLAVVAQVLAEATARALGFDPDAPHGLTKVTQTAR